MADVEKKEEKAAPAASGVEVSVVVKMRDMHDALAEDAETITKSSFEAAWNPKDGV